MSTISTTLRLNDMMSASLHNIVDSMDEALVSWERLRGSTSEGLPPTPMDNYTEQVQNAIPPLDQLGEEQRQFNEQARRGNNDLDGLSNSLLGYISAYASLRGLQSLGNLSDNYTTTVARLSMIVDDGKEAEELLDMIYASADRARAPVGEMAETVAKLSLNAPDAFSNNNEAVLFAENLNKLFKIAGTEQAAVSSATLQLTQALGSGVLRGEELNAVFEAAPNIIQTVADYMDVPIGQMRELASEGQLSADVVKAALLGATDEINERFESVPMRWSDVWTDVTNRLYYGTLPLLELINLLAQNWAVLEPVVLSGATAIGIYAAALLIYNGIKTASALAESVHGAALMMNTGATFMATAAQYGFNAALLACPITWIVISIIAVVAVFYALIAAINQTQDTTISATGVITGAIAFAGAVIFNTFIGLCNAIIQSVSSFAYPFLAIIEWILNVMNGGFDSFGDAVQNLIGNIIGWFLSLGQVVTTIIDAIFGTNWTAGLENLSQEVRAWGKNENAISLDPGSLTTDYRIDYGDAFNSGYQFGEGLEDKIGGFFGDGLSDTYSMEGLLTDVGDIADSTAGISDSLEITGENLRYLRDIAERGTINRFTTAEIHVEMGGVQNNISQNTDLDGVMDYFVTGLKEASERVAEEVHR